MKKIILCAAVWLCCSAISAEVLTFITKDFDLFLSQVVSVSERNRFNSYYQKLQQKMSRLDENNQKKVRFNIYQTALNNLDNEHHVWAEEIKLFLSDLQFLDTSFDKERSCVRQFLSWYGSYAEFQTINAAIRRSEKGSGFLEKVKQQFTKATNKIGDWFRSWRQTPFTRFTTT